MPTPHNFSEQELNPRHFPEQAYPYGNMDDAAWHLRFQQQSFPLDYDMDMLYPDIYLD